MFKKKVSKMKNFLAMRNRRRNEVIVFLAAVTLVTIMMQEYGAGYIMFKKKFETLYLTVSTDAGNNENSGLIVLKRNSMLDNHSYFDGTQSLLYYEKLLRHTEKRPLSEYSTNQTKTILVWTENWDLWNEMPKYICNKY